MTDTRLHGAMIHPGKADETAVYRLYDVSGKLLYVGISRDPMTRWAQHQGQGWWTRVASYAVSWHPDRVAAAREESEAIEHEAPVHNRPGDTVLHAVNTAAGTAVYQAHLKQFRSRQDAAWALGPGAEREAALKDAHAEFDAARRSYLADAKKRRSR